MAERAFGVKWAHYGVVRSSRDHDLDALTDLAVAAQDGDRTALGELSRELQQPIYRLALRYCGHPIDAEDVALEVMLRLLTTLESYDRRSGFTVWVYANAVRQLLRSEPRSAEVAASGAPPRTPGALVALPREQRIAYILTDLLGFAIPDAAEICATDPATYRARLVSARTARTMSRRESPADAIEAGSELAAPNSVWSRLVATMPTHLGAE
jgi:DNA-directed RNA polymerase specialized sigma24 family protein